MEYGLNSMEGVWSFKLSSSENPSAVSDMEKLNSKGIGMPWTTIGTGIDGKKAEASTNRRGVKGLIAIEKESRRQSK